MKSKQILALLCCAALLTGLIAGCGGTKAGEEKTTLNTLPPDIAATGEETPVNIPEGWFAFATADKDNNVTVDGFSQLVSVRGGAIAVSDKDEVAANLDEITGSGKINSITVRGNAIPVLEVMEAGTRRLYAKGSAENDPTVVDLTTEAAGAVKAATAATVPTTKKITTAKATTTRATTTTLPPKAATVPTTKKPKVTTDPFQADKDAINNSNMTDKEKATALKFLSYQMDKNGIFYVEHEQWQKQFGFSQIYDMASPVFQMIYGTVRVKFRYDYVYKLYEEGANKGKVVRDVTGKPVYDTDSKGNLIPKDWMVQMWKGRYGLVMLGAEIGIYTKPSTQSAEFYYAAVPEEEIIMAFDVYHKNFSSGKIEHLFTRGPESAWWLTGFVPGAFYDENSSDKKSEVICVGNLQFQTVEMAELFAKAFEKCGFNKGSPGRDHPETYLISDRSVKFSWQWIDQDKKG